MHIKQITISNFRSFRQQSDIQPFSPSTNTVVGRNGSGKSNLFDAVQFCLCAPRFANLRPEERQAILHEGSGSAAVNAYVEIVFDNSDHRFQLENSDEVVLRRTVGLKKDEFFLQRKRATKSEVQSLLEGAGFSKSNPYYVVQQGKVQDLCIMSDINRLNLLKEVAGTTLYDEKKSESLAKMEENSSSIEKITEMLDDIETRLDELQSEKDELHAYQQADRSRRAAEYCLYDKELRKARSQLDSIEHERSDHAESASLLHDTMKENHDAIRQIETVLKTKSNVAKRNRNQIQLLDEDNKRAVQDYTRLQIECKELRDQIKAGIDQEEANKKHLAKIENDIATAQSQIQKEVQPSYEAETKKLQALTDEYTLAKHEADALHEKQIRGRQFQTKKQRDAHIRKQEQEIRVICNEKQSDLTYHQNEISKIRKALEKETKQVESAKQDILTMNAELQMINKSIGEKKLRRLELHDIRKEDWRKTEECQEQVREARENMHAALSDLKKVMPKATAMGLDALEKLVDREKIKRNEQYFGTILDNMTLKNDKYATAVEVAAQNALYHVIVDTDHTAARLMKKLEDNKLGRVTFLPLSQLRIQQNIRYPDSNDVRPMLGLCLEYDTKVAKAMEHVFNKKLIARSPEVASEWSTKSGMDAITLDGDLCSRKGALTGGYVDSNRSRITAQKRFKSSQAALEKYQEEYQKFNGKAQQTDAEVTTLMQEIQRLEARNAEVTHSVDGKESSVERLTTRATNQTKKVEEWESIAIPTLQSEIGVLETDMRRLNDEMKSELQENLSNEEISRQLFLQKQVAQLSNEVEKQTDLVSSVQSHLQKLTSLLEDNLLKRRDELLEGPASVLIDDDVVGSGCRAITGSAKKSKRILLATAQQQRSDELDERTREIEISKRIMDDVNTKLEEARSIEQQVLADFNTSKNELENLKNQSTKINKDIEEAQDKSERLLNKRTMCISKRETYIRKIQELGSLPPPSELEKFDRKTIPELMKSLESINKSLKKYSHVNKKAYDQYVNFSEQRESLLKRKEELDRGADKVKELIESLDRQKDEAINRTFRGVSAHFKDVFKELVPNGAGELIMRTTSTSLSKTGAASLPTQESKDDSDVAETAINDEPDVGSYQGIGIKVRFSQVGENYMMSQLSGGQKALVALALIFSIQRCDPAPFYLFDELDQALDSTYRASVANLIQRQSSSPDNPTQFIVSTFRQELVSIANRCFGISHQNKVSSLHPLSKKDAQSFIANLMSEEEAVGEVTTVAASRSTVKSKPSTSSSRETKRPRKADGEAHVEQQGEPA